MNCEYVNGESWLADRNRMHAKQNFMFVERVECSIWQMWGMFNSCAC